MTVRWVVLGFIIPWLCACNDETSTQSGMSHNAAYTLCDCVNQPPTTDAKLSACNEIIESMDPGEVAMQTLECSKLVPVPEDGPDFCYCLHASSDDPEIMAACQSITDEMDDTTDLVAIMRNCAAKRIQDQ